MGEERIEIQRFSRRSVGSFIRALALRILNALTVGQPSSDDAIPAHGFRGV